MVNTLEVVKRIVDLEPKEYFPLLLRLSQTVFPSLCPGYTFVNGFTVRVSGTSCNQ